MNRIRTILSCSVLKYSTQRSFSTTLIRKWGENVKLSSLPIELSEEVQFALIKNQPIVALESTLITHGLPPPYSYDLPVECESILRSLGVAPATIAIINGKIKIGLNNSELSMLSELGFASRKEGGGEKLWKVGRREIAACLVKKLIGGTTVSATMAIAHLAGIKIFSTGGIGGVHRGAETSFDISSDLISLGDTPVAVICAGSKSILDIGLTLEYLETHAVPVASYTTNQWPAFYTPDSGFKSPMRFDTPSSLASLIHTSTLLSIPSSPLLLGVPIPVEYHDLGKEIQEAVNIAVRESVENGMSKKGKEVTPWLLGRVGELTQGKSIGSNMALIKNNVKVGGEIAVEYSKIVRESASNGNEKINSNTTSDSTSTSFMPAISSSPIIPSSAIPLNPHSSLTVIGSLAIDLTMKPLTSPLSTTSAGITSLTLGGVASNIASAARSLGIEDVKLISPLASGDFFGEMCKSGLEKRGMRIDGLVEMSTSENEESVRSASCGILLDQNGDLIGGVADMGIVELMTSSMVLDKLQSSKPELVCFDGNLSISAIADVLKHCRSDKIPTFFEPTSNQKSLRGLSALESIFTPSTSSLSHPLLQYSTPNLSELITLYSHVSQAEYGFYEAGEWFDEINVSSDSLGMRLPNWIIEEGLVQMGVKLLPVVGCLFIKSGSRGLVVVQRISGAEEVALWKPNSISKRKNTVVAFSNSPLPSEEAIVIRYYPAIKIEKEEIVNVTGAGDNLAGGILSSMIKGLRASRPEELDLIIEIAQKAAGNALRQKGAVGNHENLRSLLSSSALSSFKKVERIN